MLVLSSVWGMLTTPVLNDRRQQSKTLKERKSMMPDDVMPLGAVYIGGKSQNQFSHSNRHVLLHFVL